MSHPVHGFQGDLFSEAPKPPASGDKNLNEKIKSTAHAAGNANIPNECGQCLCLQRADKKWKG